MAVFSRMLQSPYGTLQTSAFTEQEQSWSVSDAYHSDVHVDLDGVALQASQLAYHSEHFPLTLVSSAPLRAQACLGFKFRFRCLAAPDCPPSSDAKHRYLSHCKHYAPLTVRNNFQFFHGLQPPLAYGRSVAGILVSYNQEDRHVDAPHNTIPCSLHAKSSLYRNTHHLLHLRLSLQKPLSLDPSSDTGYGSIQLQVTPFQVATCSALHFDCHMVATDRIHLAANNNQ